MELKASCMRTPFPMKMTHRSRIVLPLILMCMTLAHAQTYDTLRVATYNLLNYPGTTSDSRNPEFRKVLRVIDPDVLIVQEMLSSAGVTEFLDEVLNFGQVGTYANAPFSNGPDTDNALFYKPSRVSFQSQVVLVTALRDINGYIMRPVGVASDSLDFRLYSGHLKSSQGEEAARFAEADIVRNHLNGLGPGHYIFGGDFNLYTSAEDAYVELIGSQADNDGRLYDVINQPGSWHDNASFAAVHTQSPRLSNLGDGGATGGMDDRFDFLLPTYGFQTLPSWQVVPGSYTEFGNDGAHFDESINNGSNSSVPDSIADALHVSSDHIPVFMDIIRQVTAEPTVTVQTPNGGESFGTGDTVSVTWSSTNYSGTVSVSLSRNGAGGPFETLATNTDDDGLFKWVTTGSATTLAYVKIALDSSPTTTDLSNANFSITQRELVVLTPAQGSEYVIGNNVGINWTAVGLPGTVRIELKRAPSSAIWELIAASALNTGSFGWVAAGQATDSAMIRVSSFEVPALADSSGMFKIILPTLSLIRPNGGESFVAGASEQIQWSQTNLTGTVTLAVNRTYPSGPWELIAASVSATSSPFIWLVTGPATIEARIRIVSNSLVQVRDSSNASFSIVVNNQPPVIGHNPLCDAAPGNVDFFCTVTDDGVFATPYLILSVDDFLSVDSVALSPVTGAIYSTTVTLADEYYDYFLRATDAGGSAGQTDTFELAISSSCGMEIAYDDGSAETYQWSPDTGFAWGVRFTPPATPFVLCAAKFALSAQNPDTLHGLVNITVYSADGISGLPGTVLGQFSAGSLPNPLTGIYASSPIWGEAILVESGQGAIQANSDFYIAVESDSAAWGLDVSGAVNDRSVIWDPCEGSWRLEDGLTENSRDGQRMIRAVGWVLLPPELVISTSGNDAVLHWSTTGAPHYTIYRTTNPLEPFDSPLAVVSDTSFTDIGVVSTLGTAFYLVRSTQ